MSHHNILWCEAAPTFGLVCYIVLHYVSAFRYIHCVLYVTYISYFMLHTLCTLCYVCYVCNLCYRTDRKLKVKFNGEMTEFLSLIGGGPEGTLLGGTEQ